MAVKMTSMAAVAVVLALTALQSAYALTYNVGDATGWTIPRGNGNDDFYDDWADNKNFVVGDILVFNFTMAHNVAEVTEAAYDACTTTNPITTMSTSPARITLNRTGDYHFICTIPTHCSQGQKLSVEVRGGSTTAPTPGSTPTTPGGAPTTPGGSPTTPGGTPTTPAGTPANSASSTVAAISLVLVSIALVLFC